jgi:NAD(P)-dependent dehydrogenase (short-subunit alcohol dehydrogenase family)
VRHLASSNQSLCSSQHLGGENVWLVGRNPDRLRFASKAAESAGGGGRIHSAEVDVVNAQAVSAFVDRVASVQQELHALVHNAGALFHGYGLADDGTGAHVGDARAGTIPTEFDVRTPSASC